MSLFVYLKMYLEGFVSIQKPGVCFAMIMHTHTHHSILSSSFPSPFPRSFLPVLILLQAVLSHSHVTCILLVSLLSLPVPLRYLPPSPAPFLLTCVHTYVHRFKYRFCIGGKICGVYVFASGLFHLTK